MTGTIFDIKEFSIHDGPGGRVTVFFKGCPLSCLWCHNPEGLSKNPQLMYKENLCSHCRRCEQGCSHEDCRMFDRCIHACPNGALSVAGTKVSSDELSKKILSYKDFFDISGGGVTFSGGEPLMQSDFLCEVLGKLDGVHKAIQTSGYVKEETYKKVIDKMDYVLQDIKIADEEKHIKYTGVSNGLILKNIEYLKNSGKEFVLRVPLIPGITDTEENLCAISKIAGDSRVELLRYNVMAGAKYEMLGMKYTLPDKENEKKDYTKFFINAKME